jgi:hypothetical protein
MKGVKVELTEVQQRQLSAKLQQVMRRQGQVWLLRPSCRLPLRRAGGGEFKKIWDQLSDAGLKVIAFETPALGTLHLQMKCAVAIREDGAFAFGSELPWIDSYLLFTSDGTFVPDILLLNDVDQRRPDADREGAEAVDRALADPVAVVSVRGE